MINKRYLMQKCCSVKCSALHVLRVCDWLKCNSNWPLWSFNRLPRQIPWLQLLDIKKEPEKEQYLGRNSKKKSTWFWSKSYNTRYSKVVPHPSTRRANRGLTSEIGRDPVEPQCMVVAEKNICGLTWCEQEFILVGYLEAICRPLVGHW